MKRLRTLLNQTSDKAIDAGLRYFPAPYEQTTVRDPISEAVHYVADKTRMFFTKNNKPEEIAQRIRDGDYKNIFPLEAIKSDKRLRQIICDINFEVSDFESRRERLVGLSPEWVYRGVIGTHHADNPPSQSIPFYEGKPIHQQVAIARKAGYPTFFYNGNPVCKQWIVTEDGPLLRSFNKNYQEVKIQEDDQIELFGVVIGLAREFYL